MLSIYACVVAHSLALPLVGQAGPLVETAGAAAARLGVALDRPVEVERALRGLPVLVDAPGLGEVETLRALALALRASLFQDGEKLRIERTATDLKDLKAAHLAWNRARMAAGLATWDRILKRADGLGDAAAQVRRAQADMARVARDAGAAIEAKQPYAPPADLMGVYMVTPAGRLLHDVMARVGIDRLADLAPGEVRFSSNRPNLAESPLPNCGDLLAAYSRTQSSYAADVGLPDVAGPPAKIVLKTNERGANLDVYDARGRRVDNGFTGYDMRPVIITGTADPAWRTAPKSGWRALDAPTRRVAPLFRSASERFKPEALPEEYLHPERFDPLGFVVRTGVLALPRPAGSKGLVAALSDGLLHWADLSVSEDRLDVAEFARRLEGDGGFERTTQNGVAIVRPKDSAVEEWGLTDREVLGREIRRIVADRDINLRNWSLLHLALYTGHENPAVQRYLSSLMRLGFRQPLQHNSHAPGAYALVGAGLRAGIPVVAGSAPPFAKLVTDGLKRGWLRFSGPSGTSDLALAPSSILAALVGAKVAFASSAAPIGSIYNGMSLAELRGSSFLGQDAESLGALAASFVLTPGETPPLDEQWMRESVKSASQGFRYRFGRRLSLGVDVVLQSGLRGRVEVQDMVADQDSLSFDGLPQPFREGIMRGIRNRLTHPVDTTKPPPGLRSVPPPATGSP